MSTYEISKSSLLSLKAEILRKQEDLTKARVENEQKIRAIKKKTPLEFKNKGVEDRQRFDLNEEEQDLLKLSKSRLEAKARLYEKLSNSSDQSEEIKRKYLVRFDKKGKVGDYAPTDDPPDLPVDDSEDEERHFSDGYDSPTDPSEEWVDYTDCLGRSRKCLRKDLEYIKSKDADLRVRAETINHTLEEPLKVPEINVTAELEETEIQNDNDAESQKATEESELISGDMRREMLRKQWEKEEDELQNKTDIHYQNVLFNEARQHGVGYYAFSKDEDERAKQQEALKKLRQDTQQQQKKAQELKVLREKQMAARMKAARNRKRARMGLPPEEDDPNPPPQDEPKQSYEDLKKLEEQKKAEEAEKLLNEARKRHIRPWDIGKEGVKEHYEMTQEEWNDKQRQERVEEFAPPTSYGESNKREFRSMKLLEQDGVEKDKSLRFSSKNKGKVLGWTQDRENTKSVNPYKNSGNIGYPQDSVEVSDDEGEDQLLKHYRMSENLGSHNKNNYYDPETPTEDEILKDYRKSSSIVKHMEPIPIINECEETAFDDALRADYSRIIKSTQDVVEDSSDDDDDERSRKRGVEIAPPPTFDYYGPSGVKKVKNSQEGINIADSIEAGLRFLRRQAEVKEQYDYK